MSENSAEYWAERIADGQRRVAQMRADRAAGMSEAESAQRNGFHTRKSFAAMVAEYEQVAR